MPFVRVELTPEVADKLTQLALEDLRPNQWEAEWLLQDAIRKGVKRLEKRRQREAALALEAQGQAAAGTEPEAIAVGHT
jgi:predicted transcriptional regulator